MPVGLRECSCVVSVHISNREAVDVAALIVVTNTTKAHLLNEAAAHYTVRE
jgi:hypothetical protein